MPTVNRQAPNKRHTQSWLFSREKGWTAINSRQWLQERGKYTDGHHKTATYHRWRQYDPDDDRFEYRNQDRKNGKRAIVGIPK